MSGDTGLLLLCEAELGKPMLELRASDYKAGQRVVDEGRCSTWGMGQTIPSGWKDAGAVHESLKGISMVSAVKKGCLVFSLMSSCSRMSPTARLRLLAPAPLGSMICCTMSTSVRPRALYASTCLLTKCAPILGYDITQICLRYLFRVKMTY